MRDKDRVWKIGEAVARKYLENKGYEILEQNYRTRYAEIDLVAQKNEVLVFIEVRTKTGELFGSPEETINRKKLKRIWQNADNYVKMKKWNGQYRIDAVGIVLNLDSSVARLEHYEDIIN
ncbi:YraN family protein [Patescibacteria group bacterium]|nr:YraN family protein [Patescibacteria group bacterium]